MINWIQKLLGDPKAKDLKRLEKMVEQVNIQEEKYQKLSSSEFYQTVENFHGKNFRDNEKILLEMLAIAKNACRRLEGSSFEVLGNTEIWKMIPYDVQIIGAIALLEGKIAEMRTGEGKTLVAGIAASIAAFAGKGVHVVTVNDYLAQRDALWNTPLFEKLGHSVDVVINKKTAQERKKAYKSSITYGTNNEFGFDYLRDNMAQKVEDMVQQPLYFAIVDEVDSILIDEARTPLIISAPAGESTEKYKEYAGLVSKLQEDEDYTIDEKQKTAVLTEQGITTMENLLGVENIYTERGFKEVHHIEQALRAIACFKKDTDYVLHPEHGVVIVDEFTGRLMPGRRYSDGLHQALEAKENVEVRQQSKTLASITFQNYFRLYDHLAGMSGSAETEEEEFANIYHLLVLSIPTNREPQRIDKKDVVFKNEKGKFLAIAQIVKEKNQAGQPVLIGTASIEKSEILSHIFTQLQIPHNVLNAKHHEQEAEIIANAGQKKSVTIATNMAGRGTDIRLGEGIEELGGLSIIGSERHESRRIDNQLRGRAGRQGDAGETQFFVALDDQLMRLFGGEKMLSMMDAMNVPDDLPIENALISRGIENAQKKVESMNFDRRKQVLQYDNVMNRHREIIYDRRRKILENEELHGKILEMIREESENIIEVHTAGRESHKWDIKEIFSAFSAFHKDENILSFEDLKNCDSTDEMASLAIEFLTNQYNEKRKSFPSHEIAEHIERMVSLRIIDTLFMEHIQTMTQLKEQVALRAYGQRDPLMEYKGDGFHTFKKLLADIRKGTLTTLFHVQVQEGEQVLPERNIQMQENPVGESSAFSKSSKGDSIPSTQSGPVATSITRVPAEKIKTQEGKKVGRNDDCPCGSGKKFKKCCSK